MIKPESQDEPSMEEILASIRRIISEDDEEKPAKEEAKVEKAPEPEEPEEDVLELTEVAEEEVEEASQDDIDNMFDNITDDEEEEVVLEAEPEEEILEEPSEEEELVQEDEPEEEEEVAVSGLLIDDVDPAEGDDILISQNVSEGIMGQFDALSELLTSGYQGSGHTLEDLVRELLRPMLKVWLEKNLPELAERMVAKEIARLARTKKP
jgi:uncharacterized protein